MAASFLDLHLETDSESQFKSTVIDKTDYIDLPIVTFSFRFNNISSAPVFIVYAYQLIRYSRTGVSIRIFLIEGVC